MYAGPFLWDYQCAHTCLAGLEASHFPATHCNAFTSQILSSHFPAREPVFNSHSSPEMAFSKAIRVSHYWLSLSLSGLLGMFSTFGISSTSRQLEILPPYWPSFLLCALVSLTKNPWCSPLVTLSWSLGHFLSFSYYIYKRDCQPLLQTWLLLRLQPVASIH